jgi:hypothetical protein
MQGKRIYVSVRQEAALRWICERSGLWDGDTTDRTTPGHLKALRELLEKAEAARTKTNAERLVTPDHDSIDKLETELLVIAGPAAAKMGRLTASEYVILTNQIKSRKIVVDEMRVVARWLRRQKWMTSPATLKQVVWNWGNWYGRAAAEGARPSGAPVPLGWEGDSSDVD